MSGGRGEVESGAAERLIFFSDAVVAIAITLLAIDLPLPAGRTTPVFWASVRHNADEYLAFLVSFIVIARAWSQHHHVMRYAERTDTLLGWLNMGWLLTIVLNPFATRLLTSEGHDSLTTHALRFGFYATLQVIGTATFLALVHHMVRSGLQAPDMPRRIIPEVDWASYGVLLGFGLSIPVFFVTREGWLLWIAGPLVVRLIDRRRRGRDPSGVAAAA